MTYSILARDPATGSFGVAAQSHFFGVGSVLPWAEPGLGAVATQAFVNPSYGPLGLQLMRQGMNSADALTHLVEGDPGANLRQVAMIDRLGHVAVHTGSACIEHAGFARGEHSSAQANMMATDRVWHSMMAAYTESADDLAHRLLSALQAGEAAGGDIRGRQSACIMVVTADTVEAGGAKLIDLRVDDSKDPLGELDRLLTLHEHYQVLAELLADGMFDHALADERLADADARLKRAQSFAGDDNKEFTFWRGVILARAGRTEEARDALAEATSRHAGWAALFRGLPASGSLPIDPSRIEAILGPLTEPPS